MNAAPVSLALADRAKKLINDPPFDEYMQEHMARSDSPYDQDRNPDGYIPMSVAENVNMTEAFLERLAKVGDVPDRVLGYDSMIGSDQFRGQVAEFLSRAVIGRTMTADQLAVLNGAGSALELAFYAICDPGQGVLVPTPSYAGFWLDLNTRDQVEIVTVPTSLEDNYELTTAALDRALAGADCEVKALLLTNPDNPSGRVWTAPQIDELLTWAETNSLHVVIDEIYALSVFGDREFVSAAKVRPSLGDNVHIVWAFSKDFGASGLRCGVLASENQDLLAAVDALAYWSAVSGHTQYALGQMIDDRPWVDGYLNEMQAGLRGAYEATTGALDDLSIPYIPSDAGFFLLIDLRQYMAAPTWEAERELWWRILDEANVNITPGSSCRNQNPGIFRLCFAAMSPETIVGGIHRIGAVLDGSSGSG